jgi:hypothetical protein
MKFQRQVAGAAVAADLHAKSLGFAFANLTPSLAASLEVALQASGGLDATVDFPPKRPQAGTRCRFLLAERAFRLFELVQLQEMLAHAEAGMQAPTAAFATYHSLIVEYQAAFGARLAEDIHRAWKKACAQPLEGRPDRLWQALGEPRGR